MNAATISHFREIGEGRVEEFYSKGYQRRYFFPHDIYYLPKCGPDGFKLANWMCGRSRLDQLWEVVIYGRPPLIDEFPDELFFDDEVVWHQQQFGKIGQVATSNLVVKDQCLYSMVHLSDLVQRISRRREYKTKVENRFKGWNQMLLNSILNFARENNLKTVYSPSSELAMKNTDPARSVGTELFERIYDRNVQQLLKARKANGWWAIDVKENQDRIVRPLLSQAKTQNEKTICLCHDIEKGFGHTDVDPALAKLAHETSDESLGEMLAVEEEMHVKATYSVLGLILPDVRQTIESHGHCLAFHSFDHTVEEGETLSQRLITFLKTHLRSKISGAVGNGLGQLGKCRQIDYRIKGYRPPQSKIGPALNDKELAFHNFEWLASSTDSLGIEFPKLHNRIVRIPILFDDFAMYKDQIRYQDWEKRAIDTIRHSDFVAFSLHDCYAHFWLPHYRSLLEQINDLGRFKSLNEVAGEVILSNAV